LIAVVKVVRCWNKFASGRVGISGPRMVVGWYASTLRVTRALNDKTTGAIGRAHTVSLRMSGNSTYKAQWRHPIIQKYRASQRQFASQ